MQRWSYLALAALVVACGSEDEERRKRLREAGRRVAGGIQGAVLASKVTQAPYRCARIGGDPGAELELGQVGPREGVQIGPRIELSSKRGDKRLKIGVIADARGASPRALAAIGRFRSLMSESDVELLVLLGGMARGTDELKAYLRLLSEGRRWPVLVIPGDREEIPALREAIEAAGGSGAGLLDGSEARIVTIDGVSLATLPGLAHPERLVAGYLGCVHDREDADALASRLKARPGPRVWLTYAPPRLTGPKASDIAIGGIHIGEMQQSAAIAASGAQLIVHASIDEAAMGPVKGARQLKGSPVVLGVGSADPVPIEDERGRTTRSTAVILDIDAKRVSWRRITGD